MTITLVLGGARSGKSRYAESLALGEKTYIATAEAFDEEMQERIARHRGQRGDGWTTVEAPLDLVGAVSSQGERPGTFILIDCLTVWLGNLTHHQRDIGLEVERLCAVCKRSQAQIVIVSNEVGLSIVPENTMARRFRDEQGLANQAVAAVADRVVLIAAGLPLVLKG